MKTRRRIVQFGFLLLTVVGVFVVKGNAERWCPFGGVEALYTYAREGNMVCSLGVSNFYILAAVLVMTLLLRRVFCSYLCPIGAVSEWLQAAAGRVGVREVRIPYTVDRVLAVLKYVVLVIILIVTWRTAELYFRGYDPCYVLIGRHGEDITIWAYVITGTIVVASLLMLVPFCRWLCPLAAVLNPFSRVGLTRIHRREAACIGCGECSTACPMGIRVDQAAQVTAARCLSCLNCVEACPTVESGAISWGPPRALGGKWSQGALIAIVLACVGVAVAATYTFPLPSFVKTRGEAPATTATVDLQIGDLTCRGKATLFAYFLERDDELALPGYLRIEAWPGPDFAAARITFDPARTDATAIKDAIIQAYFDAEAGIWRTSPFRVAGYDPLGLDILEAGP